MIELRERIGPDIDTLTNIAFYRRQEMGQLLAFMAEVRDRYNGDILYPWAEGLMGEGEQVPLTPHLIGEGIDELGRRAGSVQPNLIVPATHPAKAKGQGSVEWAGIRHRALAATLNVSKWELLQRRALRHLAGYATFAFQVEPTVGRDGDWQDVRVRVRNPLNTYPDPRAAEDYEDAEDCLFIYAHSASWVKNRYPMAGEQYGGPIRDREDGEGLWHVAEWVDHDCMVTWLLGRAGEWEQDWAVGRPRAEPFELRRIANRAGEFCGAIGARITLDRIASALQHVVGSVDWAARLQFLSVIASERATFPDIYMVGQENRPPKLLNQERRWRDGRTGEINELADVSQIGQLRSTPDPTAQQNVDRMERNAKNGLGVVPQMSGETYGALRTGRGIDALMGAAVDPRIQEMHAVVEGAGPKLMRSVFKCWKGYFGPRSISMYTGLEGDRAQVEFVPERHFEENNLTVGVRYPLAGADIQTTNIALTQLFSVKAIGLQEFRNRHPWLRGNAEQLAKDAELEEMENLARSAFQQAVMAGQAGIQDVMEVRKALAAGAGSFLEAFAEVMARKEEEAAAEAEAQEAAAMEQQALAQAGGAPLALPAGGGEVPPAIAPTSGMEGFREVMNTMRAGAQPVGRR